MNIRVVACDDIDVLMLWRMEVLRVVFALSVSYDLSAIETMNRRYYEKHLSTGSHMAFLALVDDSPVGCGGICFYDELPSPDNPDGHCAYLMNIYVRSRYRRRGIGRCIVRRLTEEATTRGISKIYLETSDAGRRLYSEMGFENMNDMMKFEKI